MQTLRYWLKGIRFYIAAGSVLVTVEVLWWAHAQYGGTILQATRTEEVFAWLSLSLLVFTLLIGPVCKLVPKLPGKGVLFEARRMLGIAAAWFATLHVAIAEFDLFNGANPFSLPRLITWGFVLGILALIILIALAATSFDAAFRGMGVWWFRLHRLVYLAGGLIIAHAILIGAHADKLSVYIWLLITAAVLITLHMIVRWRRKK